MHNIEVKNIVLVLAINVSCLFVLWFSPNVIDFQQCLDTMFYRIGDSAECCASTSIWLVRSGSDDQWWTVVVVDKTFIVQFR